MWSKILETGSPPEDKELLSILTAQGVKAGKYGLRLRTPYSKHYVDAGTRQNIAVFSGLPEILPDGTPLEPVWYKKGNLFLSGVNLLSVEIDRTKTRLAVGNKAVAWQPIVSLRGKVLTCSTPELLLIDPDNENYNENIIEWDYGICIRRLRIIEGAILEVYIFPADPNGDVVIKSGWLGNITPSGFWSRDSSPNLPMPLGMTILGDEKRIPAIAFKNKVYPVMVDDSLTVYSTASDGYAQNGWGTPYSTVHDAASSSSVGATDTSVSMHNSMQPTNQYVVARGFLFYITSSLGSGANISAATLSLYGQSKSNQSGGTQAVTHIVQGIQHDPIIAADYGAELNYVTSGGSVTYANWSLVAYNAFTLNATALGWINKTGTTLFCSRIQGDMDNVAPLSNYWNYIGWWANEKGTGYLPKLVITYNPLVQKAVGEGATAIAGVLAKYTRVPRGQGAVTTAGTLVKNTKKPMGGGAVASVGTLIKNTGLSMGKGSIAIAGALVTLPGKWMGRGAIAIAGILAKKTSKSMGGGTVAPTGTLAAVRYILKAVGGGIVEMAGNGAGLIVGTAQAVGGGAVAIAGTLVRYTRTTVGKGTVGIAGIANKKMQQLVGLGNINIAGYIKKTISKPVGQASMTIVGALLTPRKWVKAVGSATLTPAGTLLKKTSKEMGAGSITIAGNVIKETKKAVGKGIVSIAGLMSMGFFRFLNLLEGGFKSYRNLEEGGFKQYRDLSEGGFKGG